MTPASTSTSQQTSSKSESVVSGNSGAGLRVIGGVCFFVVLAAVVGLALSGGSYQPAPEGLPDSGPVVGWGLPILAGLTFVAAFATIGWLLFATFLDAKAKAKIVSVGGRKALVRASGSALVWAILLLISAWFTLAQILGIDLAATLDPGVISTYWWDAVVVRALVIGALLAVVVSVGAIFTIRLATATLWLVVSLVAVALPALTGHAAGLGDHSLAIMNGVGHSVAATLWIGGLIALAVAAFTTNSIEAAVQRFSLIAVTCVIVLAGTGIGNTYTRLETWSDLWASGYGRLAVIKTVLLIALVWMGFTMRKRIIAGFVDGAPKDQLRRAFTKLASLELLLMALTAGFGVALSMTPPTRATIQFPTQAEELLGFNFPGPPTPASVALGISVDSVFLVLSLAGIFFYLAGVRRLRKRGDSWPISRTILWIAGCLIVLWATNASISMYASMSVGLHMIQHMTLTMLAPIGLVMGAPITLALRALKPSPTGGRGVREMIIESIHSWPGKIITNPAVVLFIYVIGLYGLYFTPLFGTLMSNHVGHIFMTLHFIVAGFLLTWVAIGIDPQPKPLPYWGKMILVIAAVTLHAFFSIALMSTKSGIGESWYGKVRPPWLTDPVQDSLMGGQIAWGIAEVPTLIILCIIGVQWWRADDRAARRRDRHVDQHGDQELDDYNAYLEALAKHDEKHGR